MPGWAKQLAVALREQEAERRRETERALERRRLFHQNAPPVWVELAVTLAMDAREFNSVFRSEPKNGVEFERYPENPRVAPERIGVRRNGHVRAELEIWLEMSLECVQYRIMRRVQHEGVTHEKRSMLNLIMDDSGKVILHHDGRSLSTEEASELVLRPILQP
jgi:hypothetical protein